MMHTPKNTNSTIAVPITANQGGQYYSRAGVYHRTPQQSPSSGSAAPPAPVVDLESTFAIQTFNAHYADSCPPTARARPQSSLSRPVDGARPPAASQSPPHNATVTALDIYQQPHPWLRGVPKATHSASTAPNRSRPISGLRYQPAPPTIEAFLSPAPPRTEPHIDASRQMMRRREEDRNWLLRQGLLGSTKGRESSTASRSIRPPPATGDEDEVVHTTRAAPKVAPLPIVTQTSTQQRYDSPEEKSTSSTFTPVPPPDAMEDLAFRALLLNQQVLPSAPPTYYSFTPLPLKSLPPAPFSNAPTRPVSVQRLRPGTSGGRSRPQSSAASQTARPASGYRPQVEIATPLTERTPHQHINYAATMRNAYVNTMKQNQSPIPSPPSTAPTGSLVPYYQRRGPLGYESTSHGVRRRPLYVSPPRSSAPAVGSSTSTSSTISLSVPLVDRFTVVDLLGEEGARIAQERDDIEVKKIMAQIHDWDGYEQRKRQWSEGVRVIHADPSDPTGGAAVGGVVGASPHPLEIDGLDQQVLSQEAAEAELRELRAKLASLHKRNRKSIELGLEGRRAWQLAINVDAEEQQQQQQQPSLPSTRHSAIPLRSPANAMRTPTGAGGPFRHPSPGPSSSPHSDGRSQPHTPIGVAGHATRAVSAANRNATDQHGRVQEAKVRLTDRIDEPTNLHTTTTTTRHQHRSKGSSSRPSSSTPIGVLPSSSVSSPFDLSPDGDGLITFEPEPILSIDITRALKQVDDITKVQSIWRRRQAIRYVNEKRRQKIEAEKKAQQAKEEDQFFRQFIKRNETTKPPVTAPAVVDDDDDSLMSGVSSSPSKPPVVDPDAQFDALVAGADQTQMSRKRSKSTLTKTMSKKNVRTNIITSHASGGNAELSEKTQVSDLISPQQAHAHPSASSRKSRKRLGVTPHLNSSAQLRADLRQSLQSQAAVIRDMLVSNAAKEAIVARHREIQSTARKVAHNQAFMAGLMASTQGGLGIRGVRALRPPVASTSPYGDDDQSYIDEEAELNSLGLGSGLADEPTTLVGGVPSDILPPLDDDDGEDQQLGQYTQALAKQDFIPPSAASFGLGEHIAADALSSGITSQLARWLTSFGTNSIVVPGSTGISFSSSSSPPSDTGIGDLVSGASARAGEPPLEPMPKTSDDLELETIEQKNDRLLEEAMRDVKRSAQEEEVLRLRQVQKELAFILDTEDNIIRIQSLVRARQARRRVVAFKTELLSSSPDVLATRAERLKRTQQPDPKETTLQNSPHALEEQAKLKEVIRQREEQAKADEEKYQEAEEQDSGLALISREERDRQAAAAATAEAEAAAATEAATEAEPSIALDDASSESLSSDLSVPLDGRPADSSLSDSTPDSHRIESTPIVVASYEPSSYITPSPPRSSSSSIFQFPTLSPNEYGRMKQCITDLNLNSLIRSNDDDAPSILDDASIDQIVWVCGGCADSIRRIHVQTPTQIGSLASLDVSIPYLYDESGVERACMIWEEWYGNDDSNRRSFATLHELLAAMHEEVGARIAVAEDAPNDFFIAVGHERITTFDKQMKASHNNIASLCEWCESNVNHIRCKECDMSMCVACDDEVHLTRSKASHTRTPIDSSALSTAQPHLLAPLPLPFTKLVCDWCDDLHDGMVWCQSCDMRLCLAQCDEEVHLMPGRHQHTREEINKDDIQQHQQQQQQQQQYQIETQAKQLQQDTTGHATVDDDASSMPLDATLVSPAPTVANGHTLTPGITPSSLPPVRSPTHERHQTHSSQVVTLAPAPVQQENNRQRPDTNPISSPVSTAPSSPSPAHVLLSSLTPDERSVLEARSLIFECLTREPVKTMFPHLKSLPSSDIILTGRDLSDIVLSGGDVKTSIRFLNELASKGARFDSFEQLPNAIWNLWAIETNLIENEQQSTAATTKLRSSPPLTTLSQVVDELTKKAHAYSQEEQKALLEAESREITQQTSPAQPTLNDNILTTNSIIVNTAANTRPIDSSHPAPAPASAATPQPHHVDARARAEAADIAAEWRAYAAARDDAARQKAHDEEQRRLRNEQVKAEQLESQERYVRYGEPISSASGTATSGSMIATDGVGESHSMGDDDSTRTTHASNAPVTNTNVPPSTTVNMSAASIALQRKKLSLGMHTHLVGSSVDFPSALVDFDGSDHLKLSYPIFLEHPFSSPSPTKIRSGERPWDSNVEPITWMKQSYSRTRDLGKIITIQALARRREAKKLVERKRAEAGVAAARRR